MRLSGREAIRAAAASVFAEALEQRRLLSTTAINSADAVPFQKITVDGNPGELPVVKMLVDVSNSGREDIVIGHENNYGSPGIYWYQQPASGNPSDPWVKRTIDANANVYEAGRAADISGHVDSQGKPVNDLVMAEDGTIVWYENPLGNGQNPTSVSSWTKHTIGTITHGVTHEMYLADIDGDGKLDVVTSDAIFFQNSPTSWTQVATSFNRTERGLFLYNSGSGLGSVDIAGTGNGPGFQVGWFQNPRDTGGNARTDPWVFHGIGPTYGGYVSGDLITYGAADINGDGLQDIVTNSGENDQGKPYLVGGLIWWQAPADPINGTWIPHTIDSTITDVHNLIFGDVNGDGTPEIFAFEQDQSPQGRLMILYNEGGTGQNWLEQTMDSGGAHNEDWSDFNGDGTLDCVDAPHGFFTGKTSISLFVNQTAINKTVRPTITSAPLAQQADAGAPASFSVAATGSGPLTYQWQQNGLDIPGANASSYTIASTQTQDDGSIFRCIVGNAAGLIPSTGAKLSVALTGNPVANLSSPATVASAGAQPESLVVTYRGASAIDTTSLDNSDLRITGPGFTALATFVSVDSNTASATRVATYMLSAPAGGWSTQDNGAYTVAIQANQVDDSSHNFVQPATLGSFQVAVPVPTNASLTGQTATAPASLNLTTSGTSDWAHWGRGNNYSTFDHKTTGGSQISNVTVVGAGSNTGSYTQDARNATWTDGTPAASDTNEHGYIWSNAALNTGFSFNVPADTTTRTLTVYAGGYNTNSTLTAHLSDGSAADVVLSGSGVGLYTNVYTITYTAASANQKLTLTLLKTGNLGGRTDGSADLIAATLSSAAATTTVPIVTTNPLSQTLAAGATVTFTAAASGNPTPTVQWQISTDNGATFNNITGNASATTTTLTLSGVAIGQTNTQCRAVFTNSAGSATSSAATLTVAAPAAAPIVTINPTPQRIAPGATATFTAAASGNPTPTVQWQISTDNGATFTNITANASATTTTLSLPGSTTAQSGTFYRAVFTNSAGSTTTGAAMLTVAASAPVVTSNPTVQSVAAGAAANFTAAATGNPTPTIQWQISTDNGVTFTNITGNASATTNTLTLPGATTAQSGTQYRAIFTNSAGSATSGAATLTVTAAPVVAGSPADQTVVSGAAASFTAAASGSPVPTVQWQISTDGGVTFANITGNASATTTTLTLSRTSITDNATRYRAVFTNAGGSTPTASAMLTVNLAPDISTGPANQTAAVGQDVVFTAGAVANPTPTVQWMLQTPGASGFTPISGATSTTLDIGPATLAENGNKYEAVFTNYLGSATTPAGTLTVTAASTKGSIAGSQAAAPSSYNLTTAGTSDWAHWGRGSNYSTFDHKATGGSQISNVTVVGSGASSGAYAEGARNATWTDGTPAASDTNEHAYIWSNGAFNTGFSFTVPADTTTRTLTVYAGGDNTSSTLTAHLSDGSAADVVLSGSGVGLYTNVYTITYTAASANQKLTLTLLKTGNLGGRTDGSADLIAATLTSSASTTAAPTVTTTPVNTSVAVGATATFTAAATGSPTPGVQWQVSTDNGATFSNITNNSSATTTTLTLPSVSTAQNGARYRAVFSNSVGSATSSAATLTVSSVTATGSLTGTKAAAAASYNLTTLGVKDWAHWGRGSNYSAFDHKATGGSQISNITVVGSGANSGAYAEGARNATWTDGTPAASDTNEHAYIWSNGAFNTGFSFTVPADTTTRTLTVYAGGDNTSSTLTAHLSDGSAADVVLSGSGVGLYTNVYTITYTAASANQKLTLTLLKTGNLGGRTDGSADLIAAMLS